MCITGFDRWIRIKRSITAELSVFRRQVKVKPGYIQTRYPTGFISIRENLKWAGVNTFNLTGKVVLEKILNDQRSINVSTL
jgi:hypothetical protein